MRGSLKEKVDSPPDPGLCMVALQGHVLHRQTTPSHTQDHPTVASDGMISPTEIPWLRMSFPKKLTPLGKMAVRLCGPHCGNVEGRK